MSKNICIYASSSNQVSDELKIKCKQLAQKLAKSGYDLIYGAGNIGIMKVIADVFLENNRNVIGVIPERLNLEGIVHPNLTKLYITSDMRKRKELMENFADAFITCPGGIGTLEEFAEIFTLKQLGYHLKPIILYNVNNFFDYLIKFLYKLEIEKFMHEKTFELIKISDNPDEIVTFIRNYKKPKLKLKWM